MKILLILLILFSCSDDEATSVTQESTVTPAATEPFVTSGDLIVSSNTADVVLALNSNGVYKQVVYNVINNAETTYGLGYSSLSSEIILTVDGVDRVVGVNVTTGTARNLILSASLSGNVRGLMQLSGGDYLIIESNNLERFDSNFFRVNTNGWPKSLQTTGVVINPTAAGGFLMCSTGSDIVATYDSDGTLLNSKASGIGGTTNTEGCVEMPNGNIAVTWNGTTDQVAIYNSDFTTTVATFIDSSILSNPTGIAARSNNNLLILDESLHHIVEITATGTFVTIIGDTVLNAPQAILVIP